MARSSNALIGLVGDIGGTNARFAMARTFGDATELDNAQTLRTEDPAQFLDAVNAYLDGIDRPSRDFVILAVAGPVKNGAIQFTNLDWSVSEDQLKAATGAPVARLINDYAALAYCLPHLRAQDTLTVGAHSKGYGNVYAVMGAGTGFGASVLIDLPAGPVCLSTESGHVAFAPVGDLERAVEGVLRQRLGRVTREHLLSGNGLVNLYQAIATVRGDPVRDLTPADITRLDGDGATGCRETVEVFWDVMAGVAGDFVLSHGAAAGVIIAGGIATRQLPHLDAARFRRRMEDKAPMSGMVHGVPSRVITHIYPALLGAANALSRQDSSN